MRSAVMFMGNSNIFGTCLSLVAFILTIFCVKPIEASIECHQHVKNGYLKTQDGEYLMETCESSSSTCFESFVKKKEGKLAIYKAGCSSCTPNSDEECRTCNTPMCNDVFAKQIKAKNRQCITDGDENSFGSQTVHCADWVNDCYYQEYKGENWAPMYYGGCGKGKFDPPDPKTQQCSTDLCNVPSGFKVKLSAQKHLKKLPMKITDAGQQGKSEAPSADNNAKTGTGEMKARKGVDNAGDKGAANADNAASAENDDGKDGTGQTAKNGASVGGDRKTEKPRDTTVSRDTDNSSVALSAPSISATMLLPVIVACFRIGSSA